MNKKLFLLAVLVVGMVGGVSANSIEVFDDAESGSLTDKWRDSQNNDGLFSEYVSSPVFEGSRSLEVRYSSSDGWQFIESKSDSVYKKGEGNISVYGRTKGGSKGKIAIGYDASASNAGSAFFRMMPPQDRYCYSVGGEAFDNHCHYSNEFESGYVQLKINWTDQNYDFWAYDLQGNLIFTDTLSNTYENTNAGRIQLQAGVQGQSYWDLFQIEKPNTPPIINSVSVSPDPPNIGENTSFTVDASDPDGTVESVRLEVFDDGSKVFDQTDSSVSGSTVNKTFSNVVKPTAGDFDFRATVTDDAGASTVETINRTLADTAPNVSLDSPTGTKFDFDQVFNVNTVAQDNKPSESLDCVLSLDSSQIDQRVITEGQSYTVSDRAGLGSHSASVTCTEQDDQQTNSGSTSFTVEDLQIQSTNAASQVFETQNRSYTLDYRTGDMVKQNASLNLEYGGKTVSKQFNLPASADTLEIITQQVPLVDTNNTQKNFNLSLNYTINNLGTGTTSKTETGNNKSQDVFQSYFIEGSSLPPRNGKYIETEDLQQRVSVNTKTKKADLTGTITYNRNGDTTPATETVVAQDLNTFTGRIDTGLADSFNQSSFQVTTDIEVGFNGQSRTLTATDSLDLFRIRLTDGNTGLDTEPALKFDVNTEKNNQDAKAKLEGDISVFLDRNQVVRRLSFQEPAAKTHTFNIFPSFAEYQVRTFNFPDQQKFDIIQYFNTNTDKAKRSYFFPTTQTINNDTTTVPLKTINRSDTRRISFEISNSEGDPAQNVYCRVDRKFPGEGFQTSFIFNTDSEGKAQGFAETDGTRYSLKCFKDGELVETFSAQKLVSPVRLQFGAAQESTRLNFFDKFDANCLTGQTFVNCSYQSQSEKLEQAVLTVERKEVVQDVEVGRQSGTTATGRLVVEGINTSENRYRFDVQGIFPDTSTQGTVGFTGQQNTNPPFSGLFVSAIIFMLVTAASAYNITIGIGAGTLTMLLMSAVNFIQITPSQRATLIAVAIIAGVAIQR